jgi:hypothetical protein
MTLLWLDDTRDPMKDNWLVFSSIEHTNVVWVKSYQEFKDYIIRNGLPDGICFDHDLGLPNQLKWRAKGKSKRESRRLAKVEEKTGYDCAKWLVDYCIDNNKQLPKYNIQSANPAGKENIDKLLKNYIKNQS